MRCPVDHALVRSTRGAPRAGYQDAGDGSLLELRNCVGCGTTVASPAATPAELALELVIELAEQAVAHLRRSGCNPQDITADALLDALRAAADRSRAAP